MHKSQVRKLTLHGMLLQAVFWFGFSTYLAFMVTTLMDYGWSASAAAGVMTAMSVVIMVTQPLYGYLSDKLLCEKKLVVALLGLTVACLALLPLSLGSGSRPLALLNMVGVTVTGTQVIGLLDAWIVGLKQEFPSLNYGMIRGIGSLTYALSAQIMGMVTVVLGHSARLWLGSGFLLLAVLAAATFRSARSAHGVRAGEQPAPQIGGREAFRLVFSSKPYCLLLGVAFFLLLSNASLMTLLQLCIRDFGGTTALIGTATAISAASEMPGMFLMACLMRKVGQKRLLVLSGAAYMICMFVTAAMGTVQGLIWVQLLQSITYAVLLPVSMSYLSQIVDQRVRSTAVTTYTAVTGSLTGILANLITSAFLATGFSPRHALVFFGFSALLGLGLALYGWARGIWDVQPGKGAGMA